jgi:hypothetical protein
LSFDKQEKAKKDKARQDKTRQGASGCYLSVCLSIGKTKYVSVIVAGFERFGIYPRNDGPPKLGWVLSVLG